MAADKRAAKRKLEGLVAAELEFVKEHPIFRGRGWKRWEVIAAMEALDKIDSTIRKSFDAMITEPGVPPKIAISILDNVASKPKREQKQIAKLYDSGEPDSMALAKSRAAGVPLSPPVDLSLWTSVLIRSERALKQTRPKYKRDAMTAITAVVNLTNIMRADFKEFQKKEGW